LKFGLSKNAAQNRRSEFIPLKLGLMSSANFGCHSASALVVPQEDDFARRLEFRPAANRVALDYCELASERLRNGEER
jgi:hypothetical protein